MGFCFRNQFVNVRLLVDTMTGATLAPNPAIQLGASGDFVYLLNDDLTVSKRDVVTGPTDGKHTVITTGLKAGDKVVIDGVDRLRDGAKVKVVDPAAAGSGDGSAKGAGRRHRQSAGQPAGGAEACAAALPPEAKAIYAAAAPEFAAAADPRAMVRAKVGGSGEGRNSPAGQRARERGRRRRLPETTRVRGRRARAGRDCSERCRRRPLRQTSLPRLPVRAHRAPPRPAPKHRARRRRRRLPPPRRPALRNDFVRL